MTLDVAGRRGLAVLVTLAVAWVPQACGDDEEEPLVVGTDGSVSIEVPAPRGVHSFADVPLCVSSSGERVEVLDLEPRSPENSLEVTDFDVVTTGERVLSNQERRMDRIRGWRSHDRVVDQTCGDADALYLAMELTKGDGPASRAPSFLLTYRSGGTEYESVVDLPITLCDPWPCGGDA